MSRWKVEAGFWWVAMQVDERGREIPGTAKRFPTHAEALAYADRKARTRRYVLPPVDDTTTIDEDDLEIMIFSIADHICITQPRLSEPGEIDVVAITPEFAEEVALALLAHAERMGE